MKSKRHSNIHDVALEVGLNPTLGELAELKANLTAEIIKASQEEGLTHKEVAEVSGVPRSAVTKIVNGSLQRVTIDKLMRVLVSLERKVSVEVS